jgi:ribosomal protein L37E
MKLTTRKFVCPSCGYPELVSSPYERMGLPPWSDHGSPPYSQRYGTPSYDVCACCGFEYGNDDEPGTAPPQTFAEYLADWITRGCVWCTPSRKPDDWSLETQLRRAGIRQVE